MCEALTFPCYQFATVNCFANNRWFRLLIAWHTARQKATSLSGLYKARERASSRICFEAIWKEPVGIEASSYSHNLQKLVSIETFNCWHNFINHFTDVLITCMPDDTVTTEFGLIYFAVWTRFGWFSVEFRSNFLSLICFSITILPVIWSTNK